MPLPTSTPTPSATYTPIECDSKDCFTLTPTSTCVKGCPTPTMGIVTLTPTPTSTSDGICDVRVTASPGVILRTKPEIDAPEIKGLSHNTIVEVLGIGGLALEWYLVQGSSDIGWVPGGSLSIQDLAKDECSNLPSYNDDQTPLPTFTPTFTPTSTPSVDYRFRVIDDGVLLRIPVLSLMVLEYPVPLILVYPVMRVTSTLIPASGRFSH